MERDRTIIEYADALRHVRCDDEIIEAGGEIRTYFDTPEVADALLGMEAFYDHDMQFVRAKFESGRALVFALAGAGWLGTISMLTPHQVELLSLLGFGFGRHHTRATDLAEQFWKDAGVIQLGESLQSLSRERIAEIIRHQAGAAATFFKAVQSVAGTWQTRLRKWTSQRILSFDQSKQNLADLVATPDFDRFRRALDQFRATRPANNFADAAALSILAKETDDFRSGRSRIFPCFYASRRLLENVLATTAREDAFTVVLRSGLRTSSLRTTPYFVLKGIQSGAEGREPLFDRDALRRLEHDLHTLSIGDEPELGLHPGVAKLLAELTNLGFFDRVWLPYAAMEDTTAALQMLNESAAVTGTDIQTAIAAELHRVQSELHANAATYRTLARLNEDLRRGYERVRHLRSIDTSADPVAILGLVPFALTPEARALTSDLLRRLVKDDPVAISDVMRLYLNSQSHRASRDAEIVCAVLWPAGLDDLIVSLRRSLREPPVPLSVELLGAAAALRSNRDAADARASIARLEHRFAADSKKSRGDIAIGLARLFGALAERAKPEGRTELLRKAVEYAAAASELVDDDARRAYATNQALYYLLQTETAEPEALRRMALRLLPFQEKNIWQYRFDDTLALYFLTRANAATESTQRRELLEMAAAAIKRAAAAAPADPEVLHHQALIQLRVEEERD
jgi:hypothetical protein